MKLTFIHAGQERTLAKHPAVQHDLRTGAVTEQVAASKPWYLRFATAGKTYSFKLPTAEREAIRAAKDILNGRLQRPDQFAAFLGGQRCPPFHHHRSVGRRMVCRWVAIPQNRGPHGCVPPSNACCRGGETNPSRRSTPTPSRIMPASAHLPCVQQTWNLPPCPVCDSGPC